MYQRSPVCCHIDSVGQSADNHHIGIHLGKLTDNLVGNGLAILSGMASAYHTHKPCCIEINWTFAEKQYWGIDSVEHTLWKGSIAKIVKVDGIGIDKFHLAACFL